MGWQDRDYVRPESDYRPFGRARPVSLPFGGSIVTTLVVANIAVYVLGAVSRTAHLFFDNWFVMQGAAVMHGQVWRLVTSQYLHVGLGHLFFNMLTLHFMGRSLEQLWTPRKFFMIYTLCGMAGSLFLTVLAWRGILDPLVPAVGASGAIYGVIGIVAVLYPNATVYIQFLFPIRMRTMAWILGGIALLTILERGENYGGEACHLAGLVFGVWWAMKGDAWWARNAPAWIAKSHGKWRRSARQPGSSFWSKPGGRQRFAERWEERRIDQETVDRILKKVGEYGIHSLTEIEKQTLKTATERQRQRDSQAGRTDRL